MPSSPLVVVVVTLTLIARQAAGSFRGNGISIPAYLSAPCLRQYHSQVFNNVSQTVVWDKSAALSVMNRQASYQLNNTASTTAMHHALNLDASIYYGGYPEDLAQATSDLGYDLLIVRGNGDDDQAYLMAITFWRTFTCPIPVFRIGTIHDSQLFMLNSSSFIAVSTDPDRSPVATKAIAIMTFIVQGLFVSFCLLFQSTKKFLELYSAGQQRTTGAFVSITCFIQGVFQLTLGIQGLVSIFTIHGMNYVAFSICYGLGATTAIVSLFLLAYKFNSALEFMNSGGAQTPLQKSPAKLGAVSVTVLGAFLYLGGVIAICQQSPNSGFGWYNMASLYYVLFRFIVSVYFIWGHFHVIKVLKLSSRPLGKEEGTHLATMSFRLSITAVLILCSEICTVYAVFPSYYINHGYLSLIFGGILTGMIAIAEVSAVQSKRKVLKPFESDSGKLQSLELIKSSSVWTSMVSPLNSEVHSRMPN